MKLAAAGASHAKATASRKTALADTVLADRRTERSAHGNANYSIVVAFSGQV